MRRRDFLTSLKAASIGAGVRFTLPQSEPTPTATRWDMSWVEQLKGKYRAVFDSPDFSDGDALYRAEFWTRECIDVYNAGRKSVSAVLVVRRNGIWLAMNDDYWTKYAVGKRNKFKDSDKRRWYDRNPVATESLEGPEIADISIPKFIARSGIVLACHRAFREVVTTIKLQDKLDDERAEALARTYIIPGVILQPSGVFAVLRAQDAGCHYILAS